MDTPDKRVMQECCFLYLDDLMTMFSVGRSKARLMLDKLGSEGLTVRIGGRDSIQRDKLMDYIASHGGIQVTWPKRKR